MGIVAKQIASQLGSASWVRRMFDEATRLRTLHGAENVYDFSLGNPHLEPPDTLKNRLAELAANPPAGLHRYLSTPGLPEARSAIARLVSTFHGRNVGADNVVVTCGAASALNVIFKTVLEPGDEVILFAPFFAEYPFYIGHANGVVRIVETDDNCNIHLGRLAEAIGPRTRAILVNSPNNPTGQVYPAETLDGVAKILAAKSNEFGRPILLVADEPYRRLVFDNVQVPSLFDRYPYTLVASSFSKDLGLAGERIGYAVVHPDIPDARTLVDALAFCLRTLGFVNAPSMMQRLVADVSDACVNVGAYQTNRDLLFKGLREIGYDVALPPGGMFLFPRTPIADDVRFVEVLLAERILAVPGVGFSRPGRMRLSLSVNPQVIEKALPGFERAFRAS